MKLCWMGLVSLVFGFNLALADGSKVVDHHFKKGETLWFISLVYYGHGGEFPKIVEANHFLSAETLKEGDVIHIPNSQWNPETAEFKTHYQEKWKAHQARLNQEKPESVVAVIEPAKPKVHKNEAEPTVVVNISNRPAPESHSVKVSDSNNEPTSILVVPIPSSPLIPPGTDIKGTSSSGNVGHRSASENN